MLICINIKAWCSEWGTDDEVGTCCAGENKVFTLRMTAGAALAMTGFCLFGHAKLKQQPKRMHDSSTSDSETQKGNVENEPLLSNDQPSLTSATHRV